MENEEIILDPAAEPTEPAEVKEPVDKVETIVPVEKTEPEVKTDPVEEPEAKKEPKEEPEKEPKEEKPEDIEEDPEKEKPAEDFSKVIAAKDVEINALTDEITQAKSKVADLESVIQKIVDSKKETIPEEMHSLIPAGNATEQLAWLDKAENIGLIAKRNNPPVEIGKNIALNTQQPVDTTPLTAQQKLSNYYSEFFSKK